jgi:hypothetical protein
MSILNDVVIGNDGVGWPVLVHFRVNGRSGCSFAAGSAVIRAIGSVLGADYNPGDHPVIAGCGVCCFLAAFRRDGAWSGSRRDCGESLRAAGRTCSYSVLACSSWDCSAPWHTWILLHIGSGALPWRLCCWCRGRVLHGRSPFIGSPRCPSELGWR